MLKSITNQMLNPVRNEIKVFTFNLLMAYPYVYAFAHRVTQLP